MHFPHIIAILRKFDPNFNESKINSAITFSLKCSNNNIPREIAEIITSIYPDSNSVIVALWFFTIENTNLKSIKIEHFFSKEIFDIFYALTKLFKIDNIHSDVTSQKTIRLLSSLDSNIKIKVLLIRFAYLLHKIIFNSISHIEYVWISKEISKIYVPLFKEIKVEKIKVALQNACFKNLHPRLYKTIISFLDREYLHYELVAQIINAFHNILPATNIEYTISGRIKSPYSIAKKIVHKSSTIQQLYDIIGIRLIVEKEQECYDILNAIYKHYVYIPERYKNLIKFPRKNGYQSLHTVIINKDLRKIEVQIRTKIMHYIAEYGTASHSQYKMGLINISNIAYNILNRLILNQLTIIPILHGRIGDKVYAQLLTNEVSRDVLVQQLLNINLENKTFINDKVPDIIDEWNDNMVDNITFNLGQSKASTPVNTVTNEVSRDVLVQQLLNINLENKTFINDKVPDIIDEWNDNMVDNITFNLGQSKASTPMNTVINEVSSNPLESLDIAQESNIYANDSGILESDVDYVDNTTFNPGQSKASTPVNTVTNEVSRDVLVQQLLNINLENKTFINDKVPDIIDEWNDNMVDNITFNLGQSKASTPVNTVINEVSSNPLESLDIAQESNIYANDSGILESDVDYVDNTTFNLGQSKASTPVNTVINEVSSNPLESLDIAQESNIYANDSGILESDVDYVDNTTFNPGQSKASTPVNTVTNEVSRDVLVQQLLNINLENKTFINDKVPDIIDEWNDNMVDNITFNLGQSKASTPVNTVINEVSSNPLESLDIAQESNIYANDSGILESDVDYVDNTTFNPGQSKASTPVNTVINEVSSNPLESLDIAQESNIYANDSGILESDVDYVDNTTFNPGQSKASTPVNTVTNEVSRDVLVQQLLNINLENKTFINDKVPDIIDEWNDNMVDNITFNLGQSKASTPVNTVINEVSSNPLESLDIAQESNIYANDSGILESDVDYVDNTTFNPGQSKASTPVNTVTNEVSRDVLVQQLLNINLENKTFINDKVPDIIDEWNDNMVDNITFNLGQSKASTPVNTVINEVSSNPLESLDIAQESNIYANDSGILESDVDYVDNTTFNPGQSKASTPVNTVTNEVSRDVLVQQLLNINLENKTFINDKVPDIIDEWNDNMVDNITFNLGQSKASTPVNTVINEVSSNPLESLDIAQESNIYANDSGILESDVDYVDNTTFNPGQSKASTPVNTVTNEVSRDVLVQQLLNINLENKTFINDKVPDIIDEWNDNMVDNITFNLGQSKASTPVNTVINEVSSNPLESLDIAQESNIYANDSGILESDVDYVDNTTFNPGQSKASTPVNTVTNEVSRDVLVQQLLNINLENKTFINDKVPDIIDEWNDNMVDNITFNLGQSKASTPVNTVINEVSSNPLESLDIAQESNIYANDSGILESDVDYVDNTTFNPGQSKASTPVNTVINEVSSNPLESLDIAQESNIYANDSGILESDVDYVDNTTFNPGQSKASTPVNTVTNEVSRDVLVQQLLNINLENKTFINDKVPDIIDEWNDNMVDNITFNLGQSKASTPVNTVINEVSSNPLESLDIAQESNIYANDSGILESDVDYVDNTTFNPGQSKASTPVNTVINEVSSNPLESLDIAQESNIYANDSGILESDVDYVDNTTFNPGQSKASTPVNTVTNEVSRDVLVQQLLNINLENKTFINDKVPDIIDEWNDNMVDNITFNLGQSKASTPVNTVINEVSSNPLESLDIAQESNIYANDSGILESDVDYVDNTTFNPGQSKASTPVNTVTNEVSRDVLVQQLLNINLENKTFINDKVPDIIDEWNDNMVDNITFNLGQSKASTPVNTVINEVSSNPLESLDIAQESNIYANDSGILESDVDYVDNTTFNPGQSKASTPVNTVTNEVSRDVLVQQLLNINLENKTFINDKVPDIIDEWNDNMVDNITFNLGQSKASTPVNTVINEVSSNPLESLDIAQESNIYANDSGILESDVDYVDNTTFNPGQSKASTPVNTVINEVSSNPLESLDIAQESNIYANDSGILESDVDYVDNTTFNPGQSKASTPVNTVTNEVSRDVLVQQLLNINLENKTFINDKVPDIIDEWNDNMVDNITFNLGQSKASTPVNTVINEVSSNPLESLDIAQESNIYANDSGILESDVDYVDNTTFNPGQSKASTPVNTVTNEVSSNPLESLDIAQESNIYANDSGILESDVDYVDNTTFNPGQSKASTPVNTVTNEVSRDVLVQQLLNINLENKTFINDKVPDIIDEWNDNMVDNITFNLGQSKASTPVNTVINEVSSNPLESLDIAQESNIYANDSGILESDVDYVDNTTFNPGQSKASTPVNTVTNEVSRDVLVQQLLNINLENKTFINDKVPDIIDEWNDNMVDNITFNLGQSKASTPVNTVINEVSSNPLESLDIAQESNIYANDSGILESDVDYVDNTTFNPGQSKASTPVNTVTNEVSRDVLVQQLLNINLENKTFINDKVPDIIDEWNDNMVDNITFNLGQSKASTPVNTVINEVSSNPLESLDIAQESNIYANDSGILESDVDYVDNTTFNPGQSKASTPVNTVINEVSSNPLESLDIAQESNIYANDSGILESDVDYVDNTTFNPGQSKASTPVNTVTNEVSRDVLVQQLLNINLENKTFINDKVPDIIDEWNDNMVDNITFNLGQSKASTPVNTVINEVSSNPLESLDIAQESNIYANDSGILESDVDYVDNTTFNPGQSKASTPVNTVTNEVSRDVLVQQLLNINLENKTFINDKVPDIIDEWNDNMVDNITFNLGQSKASTPVNTVINEVSSNPLESLDIAQESNIYANDSGILESDVDYVDNTTFNPGQSKASTPVNTVTNEVSRDVLVQQLLNINLENKTFINDKVPDIIDEWNDNMVDNITFNLGQSKASTPVNTVINEVSSNPLESLDIAQESNIYANDSGILESDVDYVDNTTFNPGQSKASTPVNTVTNEVSRDVLVQQLLNINLENKTFINDKVPDIIDEWNDNMVDNITFNLGQSKASTPVNTVINEVSSNPLESLDIAQESNIYANDSGILESDVDYVDNTTFNPGQSKASTPVNTVTNEVSRDVLVQQLLNINLENKTFINDKVPDIIDEWNDNMVDNITFNLGQSKASTPVNTVINEVSSNPLESLDIAQESNIYANDSGILESDVDYVDNTTFNPGQSKASTPVNTVTNEVSRDVLVQQLLNINLENKTFINDKVPDIIDEWNDNMVDNITFNLGQSKASTPVNTVINEVSSNPLESLDIAQESNIYANDSGILESDVDYVDNTTFNPGQSKASTPVNTVINEVSSNPLESLDIAQESNIYANDSGILESDVDYVDNTTFNPGQSKASTPVNTVTNEVSRDVLVQQLLNINLENKTFINDKVPDIIDEWNDNMVDNITFNLGQSKASTPVNTVINEVSSNPLESLDIAQESNIYANDSGILESDVDYVDNTTFNPGQSKASTPVNTVINEVSSNPLESLDIAQESNIYANDSGILESDVDYVDNTTFNPGQSKASTPVNTVINEVSSNPLESLDIAQESNIYANDSGILESDVDYVDNTTFNPGQSKASTPVNTVTNEVSRDVLVQQLLNINLENKTFINDKVPDIIDEWNDNMVDNITFNLGQSKASTPVNTVINEVSSNPLESLDIAQESNIYANDSGILESDVDYVDNTTFNPGQSKASIPMNAVTNEVSRDVLAQQLLNINLENKTFVNDKVPDIIDEWDENLPLHDAVKLKHKSTVELLLSQGAEVNQTDKYGKTPLHYAAESGCKDIVELLLPQGVDVNILDQHYKTPLHYAAESGCKDIVELLLPQGVDVNILDQHYKTPLHYAAESRCKDIVELLLPQCLNINQTDKYGKTPLHYAAKSEYKDIVELLLSQGVDVNILDQHHETPLHIAVVHKHKDIVELLLSQGADVNIPDQHHETPLYIAVIHKQREIVELLLQYRSDPNLIQKGHTPLSQAAAIEHTEIVKYFIEHKDSYKILVNKVPIMKYYLHDIEMQKFLFKNGVIPEPEEEYDKEIPKLINDPQGVHNSHSMKYIGFCIKKLKKLQKDCINEINNKALELSTELKTLYNCKHIESLSLSESEKKNLLMPLLESEKKNLLILLSEPEIVDNACTSTQGITEKNYDDIMSYTPQKLVEEILSKASNILDKWLEQDGEGIYIFPKSTMPYKYNHNDEVILPELLGLLKLLIDREPNLKEKQELCVTLFERNKDSVLAQLTKIQEQYPWFTADQLINKPSAHRLLSSLDDEQISRLYNIVSNENINKTLKEQKLFVLAKAIYSISIVYGYHQEGCLVAIFNHLTNAIQEIDYTFSDQYQNYLIKEQKKINANTRIDNSNVCSLVTSIAEDILKEVDDKSDKIKDVLQDYIIHNIPISSTISDTTSIGFEHQLLLSLINKNILKKIPTVLPNYSGYIPTNQELAIIIENLHMDRSLQKWTSEYSGPVEDNEVECIGSIMVSD